MNSCTEEPAEIGATTLLVSGVHRYIYMIGCIGREH